MKVPDYGTEIVSARAARQDTARGKKETPKRTAAVKNKNNKKNGRSAYTYVTPLFTVSCAPGLTKEVGREQKKRSIRAKAKAGRVTGNGKGSCCVKAR